MSTWASLYGSWESSLSEEQLDELTEVLEEENIEVEKDGSYSFNDSCGWSFLDRVHKDISNFAKKHKLAGEYEVKVEEGELETVFVGSDDQIKRQNYFHIKKKLQEWQEMFATHAADVTDGDLARWSIEWEET